MSAAEKPFITCHVLDTTTGKPAAGIEVHLTVLEPAIENSTQWEARTNADGRVPAWTAHGDDLNEQVRKIRDGHQENVTEMKWRLRFHTEPYYGKGNTMWPQVDLVFSAKLTEKHYHVPLLLGPWGYTTYRGS